jgi:hypothetical protein
MTTNEYIHMPGLIHPCEVVRPELWFLLTRRTAMPRKSYMAEEIVAKLRQVDVVTSQGRSAAEAVRWIGVYTARILARADEVIE